VRISPPTFRPVEIALPTGPSDLRTGSAILNKEDTGSLTALKTRVAVSLILLKKLLKNDISLLYNKEKFN
jgi:hypothetical protein